MLLLLITYIALYFLSKFSTYCKYGLELATYHIHRIERPLRQFPRQTVIVHTCMFQDLSWLHLLCEDKRHLLYVDTNWGLRTSWVLYTSQIHLLFRFHFSTSISTCKKPFVERLAGWPCNPNLQCRLVPYQEERYSDEVPLVDLLSKMTKLVYL